MWSLFQNIPLQCYTYRLLLELLITMKTLQLHYLQGQGCGGEGKQTEEVVDGRSNTLETPNQKRK